jgi:hypothetical protein
MKTYNFLSNSCNLALSSSSKSLCRWRRGVRTPDGRLCPFFGDRDLDLPELETTCASSESWSFSCSLNRRSSFSLSLSLSRSCSLLATSASTALEIYVIKLGLNGAKDKEPTLSSISFSVNPRPILPDRSPSDSRIFSFSLSNATLRPPPGNVKG